MEELDISELLEQLEKSYVVFDKMMEIDPEETLSLGDKTMEAKEIIDIDLPLSLKELLSMLEKV
jgi:hypothetical protein